MPSPLSILLVGESWFTYSVHQKGFDTFQTAEYTEGATEFIAALRGLGDEVRYIPAHRVDADFPNDPAGLAGIEGKARYGRSPLADVLPVTISDHDDRTEVPEGFVPTVAEPGHAALSGVPATWPRVLGYNRVEAKQGSTVLVARGSDPILVVGTHGAGRAAAFTPDLAPHWAPPEFVAWDAYGRLWYSLLEWLARRS